MKDRLQGGLAMSKGDPLARQILYFDTYVAKRSLFHGYILRVLV